jgi:hypothetical protein
MSNICSLIFGAPVETNSKVIPYKLRVLVWLKYIGYMISYASCYLGCGKHISFFTFECGHIISRNDGGKVSQSPVGISLRSAMLCIAHMVPFYAMCTLPNEVRREGCKPSVVCHLRI